MLGGVQTSTSITSTVGTSPTSVQSISLSVGSWAISGNAYFPSAVSYSILSICNSNNVIDYNSAQSSASGGSVALNIVRPININAGTQTWYLVAGTGSSNIVQYVQLYAFRIG